MTKVVFDSSFLMALAERPTPWQQDLTDLLGKVEPVLLDCVRTELDSIEARGGKRAREAGLAKSMAAGFSTGRCGGAAVDDEVVSYARTHGAAVATVDGEMVKTLRAAGVAVVTLHGGRLGLA